MKLASIAYAVFCVFSAGFILLVPYGTIGIRIYGFWPVTIFAVLAIMYWANKRLKQRRLILILCVIGWGVLYYFSLGVSERDKRFTMEVEGTVNSKYRGGHNLPSIIVVTGSGDDARIEGLSEAEWKAIHNGDKFVKHGGTFKAQCANFSLSLVEPSVLDSLRAK